MLEKNRSSSSSGRATRRRFFGVELRIVAAMACACPRRERERTSLSAATCPIHVGGDVSEVGRREPRYHRLAGRRRKLILNRASARDVASVRLRRPRWPAPRSRQQNRAGCRDYLILFSQRPVLRKSIVVHTSRSQISPQARLRHRPNDLYAGVRIHLPIYYPHFWGITRWIILERGRLPGRLSDGLKIRHLCK